VEEGEFVTVVEGDVHAAITRSRGNVVHIATGLRSGRSGFRLPAAQDIYSFSKTLISILRPNQPSVRGVFRVYFRGLKRPEHNVEHSPPAPTSRINGATLLLLLYDFMTL
jgi:hypothetical protein